MRQILNGIVVAVSTLMILPAIAQSDTTSKPAVKHKHGAPAKAATPADNSPPADENDEDAIAPSTEGSEVSEFNCDHGQKITFYKNPSDADHVAIRWNKLILRMRRVTTTTGADRFENKHYGLIWIGIPSKSMLLDSKKNQQLANECRNAHQLQNQANSPAKG